MRRVGAGFVAGGKTLSHLVSEPNRSLAVRVREPTRRQADRLGLKDGPKLVGIGEVGAGQPGNPNLFATDSTSRSASSRRIASRTGIVDTPFSRASSLMRSENPGG